MNKIDKQQQTDNKNTNIMEKENKPYAHREKHYMQGSLYPFIRVGMQKVNLTPTVNIANGEKIITPNAPV